MHFERSISLAKGIYYLVLEIPCRIAYRHQFYSTIHLYRLGSFVAVQPNKKVYGRKEVIFGKREVLYISYVYRQIEISSQHPIIWRPFFWPRKSETFDINSELVSNNNFFPKPGSGISLSHCSSNLCQAFQYKSHTPILHTLLQKSKH